MKIKDILKLIQGELVTIKNTDILTKEYNKAFACDLMSDCLAFVNTNCILITGLINSQALRTAEMLEIDCIIFARGKRPTKDMIELAIEQHMTLITTDYTLYEVSGILYKEGIESLKI